MNKQNKTLLQINEMMDIITESSHQMPNYVFQYYVGHKIGLDHKPIFNLVADSFLTLFSYCLLMRKNAWSQAFALLRVGLEQVAAVFVLSTVDGAADKYLDLIKEKTEYVNIKDDALKRDFLSNRGVPRNGKNDYFDYGWISSFTKGQKYGRKQLLEIARLDEFLVDIEETLNAFSHGSISVFQMSKDGWELMRGYGRRASLTCFKLYDFLCCSYCKVISEGEFSKLPLDSCFKAFKMTYENFVIENGWKAE
jgi:hypothetical protein